MARYRSLSFPSRVISSFVNFLLCDFAVCVLVLMQFYELCFIRIELCSKEATPCVMTEEGSQHKRSCRGNLYINTLTGSLVPRPPDSMTCLLCNWAKKLLAFWNHCNLEYLVEGDFKDQKRKKTKALFASSALYETLLALQPKNISPTAHLTLKPNVQGHGDRLKVVSVFRNEEVSSTGSVAHRHYNN